MDLRTFLLYGGQLTIGLSGLLIVTGVVLIRLGRREHHKKAMLSASALALVFVVLYLVRTSLYPPEGYHGEHRTLYLFILSSHTVLSLVNLPLAVITLFFALKQRFPSHKRIAPYTAGVWIYVAVTGWLIFFFLR